MLITAAMIVRNEEQFLGDCLASIAGLVDEVVVVDTGSHDRTREIAREHGARVFEFPWTDDFSAARNRALELSRGEWILYIDADERMRPGAADQVRAQLAAGRDTAGEYVWLHPRPGHTAYRVLRFFRNHPAIRFEGVIHETMWPSLHRYCDATGRGIDMSEMVLDHLGYEENQDRKHARNLPLLLRAVAADPLRIYASSHLADTYMAIGKPELAEETLLQAIRVIRQYPGELADSVLPFIGILQYYSSLGRDTAALLREARQRYPDNLHLIWMEAEALMQKRAFGAAILRLEEIVAVRDPARPGISAGSPAAYDRKLFDLYPYRALANCHFRLKNFAASRRYFRLASECDPACQEYRVKEALCARLEAQSKRKISHEISLEQTV